MRSLAQLAQHEAAHCVAAKLLGRNVARTWIDATGGITEIAPPLYAHTPENERRAAKELLVILLAGDAFDRAQDGRW